MKQSGRSPRSSTNVNLNRPLQEVLATFFSTRRSCGLKVSSLINVPAMTAQESLNYREKMALIRSLERRDPF